MNENKLTLKNRKGENVVGVLEKPIGDILGTCVVQHGWGGHRNEATVQAMKKAFLQSGFQTFNFDTTNSFGESDGDFEKSTLGLHAEDLEDVTKWVQNQAWFVGPLALTGHSKGAYAVARYAEMYPEKVSYLVPVAPVVSGELSFEANQKNNLEEFTQWKDEGVLVRIGSEGDKKVQHWFQFEERLNHNLLEEAPKLTMPTLIVVGSEDTKCPPDHQQKLFEAIPEGVKQLSVINNAPHSFNKEHEQKECTDIIRDWMKKYV